MNETKETTKHVNLQDWLYGNVRSVTMPARGLWVYVRALEMENLDSFSLDALAGLAGLRVPYVEKLVEELTDAGLLESLPDGSLTVRKRLERQP